MVAELNICQARCTTPALDFYQNLVSPDGIPERTGVSTDDHGWEKYSGTAGFTLHTIGSAFEAPSTLPSPYGWWLGYYFTNGQPSDGQFEEVVRFVLFLDSPIDRNVIAVQLYNDSGEFKFRFWNVDTDAQIGSDSAAVTVSQGMFINVRADSVVETLTLFLDDGSSILSASLTLDSIGGGMVAGTASTGTARYWSAWCHYVSASDDLNEAHYPEMRLLHPDGDGFQAQYTVGNWTSWDDLASEGDPDGDSTYLNGPDSFAFETSTLTTHTMTNTIQGIAELLMLRQTAAVKTVIHFSNIRVGSTSVVLSFGDEDIGELFVVREMVWHTEPSTGTWTQALINGMEAGHARFAGSEALNIRVTAIGLVVVALGSTDLAPADPPIPDLSWLQTSHRPRIIEPAIYAH